MSTSADPPLPVFTRGSSVLEARRVRRTASSDLILYWSTDLGPYELYERCTEFAHAPALKERLEIIADDEFIKGRNEANLRAALTDRNLVRFNFADWSIIWLSKDKPSAKAEIQALVSKPPAAMSEMIIQSIVGFDPADVKRFLVELRKAA